MTPSTQHSDTPSRPQNSPKICIIGGGFGGLYTALYLQKYRHLRQSRITLVEPKERFLFTPMMYELITDELKEWEIAPTYSSLLRGTNIDWQQTQAEAVDLQAQTVTLTGGKTLDYDYLVMATGAENRPVNIPGVAEHALTFRTLSDALTLKARLAQLLNIQTLEQQTTGQASQSSHPSLIPVTVIGGGASGVELAAKVADYLGDRGQITLVERGETLLKPFAKGLRKQAYKALAKRQIPIMTETSVTEVSAETVTVQKIVPASEQASEQTSGTTQVLPSQLTLWAVGTQPRAWLGQQMIDQNPQGQGLTRRSLQLLDYDNVFVLGDGADVRGPKQQAAPNTAQAAFQAASQVAANLARMTQGRSPKPFNYLHLGDMITLGVGEAGLWSFGLTLGGSIAALSRRGVYIFRMPTRIHQAKVARRALGELARAILFPWRRSPAPRYRAQRQN